MNVDINLTIQSKILMIHVTFLIISRPPLPYAPNTLTNSGNHLMPSINEKRVWEGYVNGVQYRWTSGRFLTCSSCSERHRVLQQEPWILTAETPSESQTSKYGVNILHLTNTSELIHTLNAVDFVVEESFL